MCQKFTFIYALILSLLPFVAYGEEGSTSEGYRSLVSDDEISCEQANEGLNDVDLTRDEYIYYYTRAQQCLADDFNTTMEDGGFPDRRYVVSGVHTPEGASEPVYYFGILEIEDITKMAEICNEVATLAGTVEGFDPGVTQLFSGVTCGSYAKALVEEDPLIFFAPNILPGLNLLEGNKITRGLATDIHEAASHLLNEAAEEVADAAEDVVDRTKEGEVGVEDVIAPVVTAPVKIFCGIFGC